MPTRTENVEAKRTVNTYVYMRMAARHALEVAEEQERGRTYSVIHALVCAAFLLEAYANHIGERRITNWREEERGLGARERLERIAALGGVEFQRGGRRYNEITQIFTVRDMFAHGRTAVLEGEWTQAIEAERRRELDAQWERVCNLEKARRHIELAEAFVRDVHQGLNSCSEMVSR